MTLRSARVWVLGGIIGVLLGTVLSVAPAAQPFTAQIQRALNNIKATANSWTAAQTVTIAGIAATSTDSLILVNTTASTAGVPVQQSPRIRLRSNVWNTTVTAANNTDDWIIESTPVSGTTPSGQLKIGKSLNGAAYTYPLILTSAGSMTLLGDYNASAAGFIGFSTRSYFASPANGQMNLTNNAVSAGVGFDVTTDGLLQVRTRAQTGFGSVSALTFYPTSSIVFGNGTSTIFTNTADGKPNFTTNAATAGVGFDVTTDAVLKVRTRAQTGYATVDALGYSVSNTAGASGTCSSVTVVNGIVTVCTP